MSNATVAPRPTSALRPPPAAPFPTRTLSRTLNSHPQPHPQPRPLAPHAPICGCLGRSEHFFWIELPPPCDWCVEAGSGTQPFLSWICGASGNPERRLRRLQRLATTLGFARDSDVLWSCWWRPLLRSACLVARLCAPHAPSAVQLRYTARSVFAPVAALDLSAIAAAGYLLLAFSLACSLVVGTMNYVLEAMAAAPAMSTGVVHPRIFTPATGPSHLHPPTPLLPLRSLPTSTLPRRSSRSRALQPFPPPIGASLHTIPTGSFACVSFLCVPKPTFGPHQLVSILCAAAALLLPALLLQAWPTEHHFATPPRQFQWAPPLALFCYLEEVCGACNSSLLVRRM